MYSFLRAECHSRPRVTLRGRDSKEQVFLLSDESLTVWNSWRWPEKARLEIASAAPHLRDRPAPGPAFSVATAVFPSCLP